MRTRNKHYRIICIGGGAGGLFFSSLVPGTLLIEKEARPGRKLLLSGGGMCNFTHADSADEIITKYYEKRNFVTPAFRAFPPLSIISYFSSLGMKSLTREDGKVFPASLRAETVVSTLESCCSEIITGCRVEKVTRDDDGMFRLETSDGTLTCEYLVIATGGLSYPATGSTGDGYSFAKAFGHQIIPPSPALCQIVLKDSLGDCEGISLSSVTLSLDREKSSGDIVITKKGISGPAAMNLSRFVTDGSIIRISFTAISAEKIKSLPGKQKAVNAVSSAAGLPSRLTEHLLRDIGDKTVSQLNKKDISLIVSRLTSFTSSCSTAGQLGAATVTRGGVDTSQVDRKTFSSRLADKLYFTGEVLDVDGQCGGYNISFAFAGSFMAAQSIISRLKHPLS